MKKSTLLIVEDDEKTRKYEKVYFSRSQYDTDFASNADEAKAKMLSHKYDIAAVDIMLPVTSGLDLADWISANFPEVKVVLCSAIAEFEIYKKYGRTLGLIQKPLYPFKIDDILLKKVA